MIEELKAYFEKAIKTDGALKKVYSEKKLNAAQTYIMDQARKELKGTNGFIADEKVYKWARDFMYGDTETPAVKTAEPVKPQPAVIPEVKKQNTKSKDDLPGQCLFDF